MRKKKKKKSCWTVCLSLISWKMNHLALGGELTSEGRASQINEQQPNYITSIRDVCESCFPAARLGSAWWQLLASSVDNGRIRCQAISSDKRFIGKHQASLSHVKAQLSPPRIQTLFVVQCKKLIGSHQRGGEARWRCFPSLNIFTASSKGLKNILVWFFSNYVPCVFPEVA